MVIMGFTACTTSNTVSEFSLTSSRLAGEGGLGGSGSGATYSLLFYQPGDTSQLVAASAQNLALGSSLRDPVYYLSDGKVEGPSPIASSIASSGALASSTGSSAVQYEASPGQVVIWVLEKASGVYILRGVTLDGSQAVQVYFDDINSNLNIQAVNLTGVSVENPIYVQVGDYLRYVYYSGSDPSMVQTNSKFVQYLPWIVKLIVQLLNTVGNLDVAAAEFRELLGDVESSFPGAWVSDVLDFLEAKSGATPDYDALWTAVSTLFGQVPGDSDGVSEKRVLLSFAVGLKDYLSLSKEGACVSAAPSTFTPTNLLLDEFSSGFSVSGARALQNQAVIQTHDLSNASFVMNLANNFDFTSSLSAVQLSVDYGLTLFEGPETTTVTYVLVCRAAETTSDVTLTFNQDAQTVFTSDSRTVGLAFTVGGSGFDAANLEILGVGVSGIELRSVTQSLTNPNIYTANVLAPTSIPDGTVANVFLSYTPSGSSDSMEITFEAHTATLTPNPLQFIWDVPPSGGTPFL
jgi:hypothetical protein